MKSLKSVASSRGNKETEPVSEVESDIPNDEEEGGGDDHEEQVLLVAVRPHEESYGTTCPRGHRRGGSSIIDRSRDNRSDDDGRSINATEVNRSHVTSL